MDLKLIISTFFLIIGLFLFIGLHQVRQGHLGLYKTFGVLQNKMNKPGHHIMFPFIQQFIPIKIALKTNTIEQIPCGTSDGIMIYFDKIQVVNKLKIKDVYETVLNYTQKYDKFWIQDKIHHEINQICTHHTLQQIYISKFDQIDEFLMKQLKKDHKKWAPGIQILSIRITKPIVPTKIKNSFTKIQKLKSQYYITLEKQKVLIQQQITLQKQAIIKQQSKYQVKIISLAKNLTKKQNQLKLTAIQAQIIFQREKTKIDNQMLILTDQAKLSKKLYTRKYMNYIAAEAYSSNTTFSLGDRTPNLLLGFGQNNFKNSKHPHWIWHE